MFFDRYYLTHLEETTQQACERIWGTRFEKYQVQSVTQIAADYDEAYLVVLHDRKTIAPITAYFIMTDEREVDAVHSDIGIKGSPVCLSTEFEGSEGDVLYVLIDQAYGYYIHEEALQIIKPTLEEEEDDDDEDEDQPEDKTNE